MLQFTSYKFNKGQLSIQMLIFGAVAIILLSGFLVWANANLNAILHESTRAKALAIAESGIEYYRWHLAHSPQDFQDGTGQPGPYAHNFYDKMGNLVGTFTLDITPPVTGSTIVTVRSTGKLSSSPEIEKIVEVKMGIPSFAKYAAVLNANVRFGEGTEVFGEIHSNGGVRFDGVAHNIVTSALSSYNDPDHSGGQEFGVHTHVNPIDPNPPSAIPTRTDIFLAGRQFPVPAVDFAGVTADLSQIKTDAQGSGFYRAASGSSGYEIIFNGNRFDLYRVTSLVAAPAGCNNSQSQEGWGTWSINTKVSLGNFAIPANGLIFIEDNLWVSGQIQNQKVTVASARFPDNAATRTSITVNNDLLYTSYNGSDVLSLIAQKNINIGLVSDTDLRIDGALMAQNGRVGRYYYNPPSGGNRCGPNHVKNSITAYGMIASNQRYGFAYTDGTGYQNRSLVYDGNLLYGPPPNFPLTTDSYKIISWKEIK